MPCGKGPSGLLSLIRKDDEDGEAEKGDVVAVVAPLYFGDPVLEGNGDVGPGEEDGSPPCPWMGVVVGLVPDPGDDDDAAAGDGPRRVRPFSGPSL